MKLLDTIKKHITSLLLRGKNNKVTIDTSSDGPTDIEIYDIQNMYYKDTINNNIKETSQPLKNLLSTKNIYGNGKYEIVNNMYKDCIELHGALIPLTKLGIGYSIDIVGGAIRDIILNKQHDVKDLDILLSLQPRGYLNNEDYYQSVNLSERISSYKGLLELEWCTKEELESVQFDDKTPLYERVNCLVQICLNRKNHLVSKQIYSQDERKIGEAMYGQDILQALNGVIKVNSPSLHYPIDLLVTEQDRQSFLQTIDFGICNVGLSFFNYRKDDGHQLTPFNKIRENFFVSTSFLKDVKNKTMTYNAQNSSPKQIEYSFSNHYPRLVAKYPDYKVEISDDRMSDETKQLLNSAILNQKLTKEMEKETKEVPKARNKI